MKTILFILTSLILSGSSFAQSVEYWLTKGDETVLLAKHSKPLIFDSQKSDFLTINIDETKTFQTIDGFGYTLTGGSAFVINRLGRVKRAQLLRELFGNDPDSIAISYLRVSMGSSDLDSGTFSYNDLPKGQTDPGLKKFSLGPDRKDLIPLLKDILRINPRIKIMASPWSAPVWMKDNNSFIGGSLKPDLYGVYADYFVKYLKQMKLQGIKIDTVTPQNEPLHGGNNPSMLMTSLEQTNFIKNHLGPALERAGLKTKLVIYDHNCDKPEYPIEVLNDPEANRFIDGSAFHLYGGDISAMTKVHNAHPDKNLYFTEQYTSSNGDFGGDLKWHIKNVVIGATRNWSRNALEWNLATDEYFRPHTNLGCHVCKGALTIVKGQIIRNVSYYIIAHASKFIPPGSVRIGSNIVGDLNNVAFKTPEGKRVLIVENDGTTDVMFNINFNGKFATTSLFAGAVGTYVW
ncbi:MAG: glycoside hydrolase family 30 beta sandwich domain-containing protein [Pyrinomonadaceae bacterium]